MEKKTFIAKRVARELQDGYVVNLGIGLPTLVANYVPEGMQVIFQAENGMLGVGPAPEAGREDRDYFNAGGAYVTARPGAVFFDSASSFAIIRGGHVDMTVLGALQVDQYGNLANWMVPGKKVPGMGGAMDLVVGARRVVVAMEHTAKGHHKILEQVTFPLTAASVVDRIITEMGVLDITPQGLVLRELTEGITVEEVQAATGAKFAVDPNLQTIPLDEAFE